MCARKEYKCPICQKPDEKIMKKQAVYSEPLGALVSGSKSTGADD